MMKSVAFAGTLLLEFTTRQPFALMAVGSIQQGDEVNVEEEKELAINRMVKLFIKAKHAEYDWVVECMNLNLFFGYEKEDIQKFIKERHKDVQGM
jgi:hypothetical protein